MGAVSEIIQELRLPFTADDIRVDVERVHALFRSTPIGTDEKANSVKVTHVPTRIEAHWIGQYPQKELLRKGLIELSNRPEIKGV